MSSENRGLFITVKKTHFSCIIALLIWIRKESSPDLELISVQIIYCQEFSRGLSFCTKLLIPMRNGRVSLSEFFLCLSPGLSISLILTLANLALNSGVNSCFFYRVHVHRLRPLSSEGRGKESKVSGQQEKDRGRSHQTPETDHHYLSKNQHVGTRKTQKTRWSKKNRFLKELKNVKFQIKYNNRHYFS